MTRLRHNCAVYAILSVVNPLSSLQYVIRFRNYSTSREVLQYRAVHRGGGGGAAGAVAPAEKIKFAIFILL